jgi:hypothetical protein
MIAAVLVEIRNKHLQNKSLQLYRYASLLCVVIANISVSSGEKEVNKELKIAVI